MLFGCEEKRGKQRKICKLYSPDEPQVILVKFFLTFLSYFDCLKTIGIEKKIRNRIKVRAWLVRERVESESLSFHGGFSFRNHPLAGLLSKRVENLRRNEGRHREGWSAVGVTNRAMHGSIFSCQPTNNQAVVASRW